MRKWLSGRLAGRARRSSRTLIGRWRRQGGRWARRLRVAGQVLAVAAVIIVLAFATRESAARRLGDSSASAGADSTGGNGVAASGDQPTSQTTLVSRIPQMRDGAPDVPWPNAGFSPILIGVQLGWGAADAEPGSSAGVSGSSRSSPTVAGSTLVLVGAGAALAGGVRALVRRRHARRRGDAAAADLAPPTSADPAADETGPAEAAEAGTPRDRTDPADAAATGAEPDRPQSAGVGSQPKASVAAMDVSTAPSPAGRSPAGARPGTTPARGRRPAGDLATGQAHTRLLPAQASSRVQLYVKTDWGPR